MLLFAATIFISAFLLFQVQPLIAKAILPWFGGTAAVWATCLVFFQTVLLLGYLYAHAVIRRLKPRQQAMLHAVLLVLAVATLPIFPNPWWKPAGMENPTWRIIGLLATSVGLPYLLVSSTGPLLQAWFVRWRPGASPYRLFALSNLGSMLGLLSYPPLIEPLLPLRAQAWTWSGGFLVFASLCAATAWRTVRSAPAPEHVEEAAESAESPAPLRYFGWIGLAATPSMMLLALTTHLTQDIASIPFLWIAPLSLYLLSFILCFDAAGWYRRGLYLSLAGPALTLLAWLQTLSTNDWPPSFFAKLNIPESHHIIHLSLYLVSFFIVCMVCHGELARLKPHPRYLTNFYLMISVGGALGGAVVALVAPVVFDSYLELPISLALAGLLLVAVLVADRTSFVGRDRISWSAILVYVACAALLGFLTRSIREDRKDYLEIARNYYGEMRVRQRHEPGSWDAYRTLLHGSINHGEQFTHPQRRKTIATYYCPNTGMGLGMQSFPLGMPVKVAVIGLGTGTIAAFGRPGDVINFYEINPEVQRISNRWFTYTKDSDANVGVILGDARLSLERQSPQHYDLIAVDAFSSDSIPVHLLTREAIELYFRHLRPGGIVAIHISNRYLNLQPVLERAAYTLHKKAILVETEEDEESVCFGTSWVVLTDNQDFLNRPEVKQAGQPLAPAPWLRTWTDDYSNLFQVLK